MTFIPPGHWNLAQMEERQTEGVLICEEIISQPIKQLSRQLKLTVRSCLNKL